MAVPFFTGGMLGSVTAIWEAPVQAAAKMRLAYVNSEPRQGTTEIGARSRQRSAVRLLSRSPLIMHSPNQSGPSAKRSSMTNVCRLTAAWHARVAMSAAKVLPTAKYRDGACRAVHSSATHQHYGIWPGRRPVFWDGRARSLEEQAAGPIESSGRDGTAACGGG